MQVMGTVYVVMTAVRTVIEVIKICRFLNAEFPRLRALLSRFWRAVAMLTRRIL
jgi:hypothetical protein